MAYHRVDVRAEAPLKIPLSLRGLPGATPEVKQRPVVDPAKQAAKDKLVRIGALENNFATWTRNAGLLTGLGISLLGIYKAVGIEPIPPEGFVASFGIFLAALALQIFAIDRFRQRSVFEGVNQTFWVYIFLVVLVYAFIILVWGSVIWRVLAEQNGGVVT